MDTNTFITILYVFVDDFIKVSSRTDTHTGPEASLSTSEVITLAIFGQWDVFASERRFYSWARKHLREAFPNMPDRSQFNRLMRRCHDLVAGFLLALAGWMDANDSVYEALDMTFATTRNPVRRGTGWLIEAERGWKNSINSWSWGFNILAAITPSGIVTGFGIGSATSKEQPMAESFLMLRKYPDPRAASVGRPAGCPYVTDTGFEGEELHRHWLEDYGAEVVSPPRKNSLKPWPRELRKWLASIRQIVETVFDKLHNIFRLDRERPHEITGFRVRLAAKFALHNFCIYINRLTARPDLAFADLISW